MKDNQENKIENLIKKAQGASLTNEEKSSMRFALSQKINSTPIPTPFWGFTFIRSYHFVPALVVILFIFGGGTSILAQKSLPGDALYPMKISVNENLESALTFSTEQSAEVQAVQATRRLEEAETLASEGLLTVKQNDEIKTSFSKKVNSLNMKLKKLTDKGEGNKATTVLNNFDAKVKTKIDKLSSVSKKATTSPAKTLVSFIKDNHEDSDDSRKTNTSAEMRSDLNTEEKTPEAIPVSLVSLPFSESTSTKIATTTEGSILNVKVMWSWKDND